MQKLCLKITVHPTSHNCTTEINVLFFKEGRICPILADCGRHGQLISHVSEVFIVASFGITTDSGFLAGQMFFTLASLEIKCAVAPESNISLDVRSV